MTRGNTQFRQLMDTTINYADAVRDAVVNGAPGGLLSCYLLSGLVCVYSGVHMAAA